MWPIALALLVHFVVVFTEKHIKFLGSFVAIYAPAIIIASIEAFTDLLAGPPVQHLNGWAHSAPDNGLLSIIALTFSYSWILMACVFTVILEIHYLVTTKNTMRRTQVRICLLALILAAGAALFEGSGFVLNIPLPPVTTVAVAVANMIFGYAVWKYNMFTLTPVTAAENIISTMNDALLLVNPQGKLLTINETACQMLSLSEHEAIGQSVNTIFSPNAPRPNWLHLSEKQEWSKANRIREFETTFVKKDGTDVPVSLSGAMLRDDEKQVHGLVLIGRDISERKNEERAKFSLEEQLRQSQKMEAIGRLAGGVAHDFNNLLTGIGGYAELIISTGGLDESIKDDVRQIREATKRAASLTSQLLTFSRKQVVNAKVIDLNEAVAEGDKLLSRTLGSDIELSFVPNDSPCHVKIDPVQVEQVLVNVAINARDAMPEGGCLEITIKSVFFNAIDQRLPPDTKPGQYALLSVADSGCGINEEVISKIFEPFYTTKELGKGTGLGLSTVYGIVKQNGGFIEVVSQPDLGAVFEIYLPIVAESLTSSPSRDSSVGINGMETILVAEDEPTVRKTTVRLLNRHGYNVLEAVDGVDALEVAEKCNGRIHLLLSDMIMPKMNGLQLALAVAQRRPEVKILFMSGYNEEVFGGQGTLGDIPFIQKPFSMSGLTKKIREVLDS